MIKANTAKEIADISNMYIAPEVQLKVDSVFAEASTSIYHAARKGRHSTEIDEWACYVDINEVLKHLLSLIQEQGYTTEVEIDEKHHHFKIKIDW